MKKLFLLGLLLSIISFFALFFLAKETYGYVISLHAGIFFVALFFLYGKNWALTIKKLGIPGNLKRNATYFVGGIIAVVLATILLNILFYFLNIQDGTNIAERIRELPLYLLFFGIFLAPISEELFFRAFLVEKAGIWISSILFAASHLAYGSIAELLGTFVIGLIFALIYKKSKSILPVIAIHFVFNLVSIILIHVVLV